MTQFVRAIFDHQVVRFLLLGGFAAAVNWLVRFPLSLIMPMGWAVVVAYAIGMTVGFQLYRTWVFPGSIRPVWQQTQVFVAVNLIGAAVVLGITLTLLSLLEPLALPAFVREGLAHGIAIGLGAAVNFIGHKTLTFRRGPTDGRR